MRGVAWCGASRAWLWCVVVALAARPILAVFFFLALPVPCGSGHYPRGRVACLVDRDAPVRGQHQPTGARRAG